MIVRQADSSEVDALTWLWHADWQDAHAGIVPAALTRARTFERFAERLKVSLADVYVVGPAGAPFGFHWVKGDELYQFYVAAEARGRGVAQALIADAEMRMAQRGVGTAWLACAIGNDRAARFYEKCGWRRTASVVSRLDTADGPFDLEVWRYEKCLAS
jgi:GNAT superfamily N-acetyltransferase